MASDIIGRARTRCVGAAMGRKEAAGRKAGMGGLPLTPDAGRKGYGRQICNSMGVSTAYLLHNFCHYCGTGDSTTSPLPAATTTTSIPLTSYHLSSTAPFRGLQWHTGRFLWGCYRRTCGEEAEEGRKEEGGREPFWKGRAGRTGIYRQVAPRPNTPLLSSLPVKVSHHHTSYASLPPHCLLSLPLHLHYHHTCLFLPMYPSACLLPHTCPGLCHTPAKPIGTVALRLPSLPCLFITSVFGRRKDRQRTSPPSQMDPQAGLYTAEEGGKNCEKGSVSR